MCPGSVQGAQSLVPTNIALSVAAETFLSWPIDLSFRVKVGARKGIGLIAQETDRTSIVLWPHSK